MKDGELEQIRSAIENKRMPCFCQLTYNHFVFCDTASDIDGAGSGGGGLVISWLWAKICQVTVSGTKKGFN